MTRRTNGGAGGYRPIGLFVMMGSFLLHCGDEGGMQPQPIPVLSVISPGTPLGLTYGERKTLVYRLQRGDRQLAGEFLQIEIDLESSGSTLSASRLITNDHGEASVLLTAGGAESAFHVVATAASAVPLSVDVAVSRFAFANLDVLVDGTQITAGRKTVAALYESRERRCQMLKPTPTLSPPLRIGETSLRRGLLAFPTLLAQEYTVVGRVEDGDGLLLAYGCVDLPDTVTKTGLRPVIDVPLVAVTPSPLGTFDVQLTGSDPPLPLDAVDQLVCADGLSTLFLDQLQQAVGATDATLLGKIRAARSGVDKAGCRGGSALLDDRLTNLLSGTAGGAAGLGALLDAGRMRRTRVLSSELTTYAGGGRDWTAKHLVRELQLRQGTERVTFDLSSAAKPEETELAVRTQGDSMTVARHTLGLDLSPLLRKAIVERVLTPRGVGGSLGQVARDVMTRTVSMAGMGCAAIEATLCERLTPPCVGIIAPLCPAVVGAVDKLLEQTLDGPMGREDTAMELRLTLVGDPSTLSAKSFAGVADWTLRTSLGESLGRATVSGARR